MQACVRVKEGASSKRAAAAGLEMSERNFYRRYDAWTRGGEKQLCHGNRGERSNRAYPEEFRERVVDLTIAELPGYTPTHAAEVLKEEYGIEIHANTLRRWMRARGAAAPSHRPCRHRTRRERRARLGEMAQTDGSFHPWFGPDSPKCCLLAMIDDATGILRARFAHEEYAGEVLILLREWITIHGIPQSLYCDRRNAYVPSKTGNAYIPAVCERLGVELINANSPQAKGRVERVFGTPRKRLTPELMRAGISTIEEANAFLVARYLPRHNERFSVPPRSSADAHVPAHPSYNLDKTLGRHAIRTVRHDWTIQNRGRLFQIPKLSPMRVTPGAKVTCVIFLDGSAHAYYKGTEIPLAEIPIQEVRAG